VSNLDHIRSYYEALNTGDAELVASHFTDDAVHYYTRLGPTRGQSGSDRTRRWASR
jgi:ketosteroid isomerase-like protein